MSGLKDAFDNYMDIILSSGDNDSSQSIDDSSDFNDIDIDEDLGIYRDIFTSKDDFLKRMIRQNIRGETTMILAMT